MSRYYTVFTSTIKLGPALNLECSTATDKYRDKYRWVESGKHGRVSVVYRTEAEAMDDYRKDNIQWTEHRA